ncbi:MAG: hypothetical protein IJ593_02005 [Lachnospiraceae bacterium]|nr:hypothetical protein [Lachnospiraceae bacterium]
MIQNKKMKKISLLVVAFVLSLTMSAFATGWVQNGTDWEYEVDGNFLHNEWKQIDGVNYHFNADAKMDKGLAEVDGEIHYFDNEGKPYAEGTKVTIMGEEWEISGNKGLIRRGFTKLADKYNIDEIKLWEQEQAEKAKEQIELIRNQKKFDKAMEGIGSFDAEQLELQNAKKANAAAVNQYVEQTVSYGKIDIASVDNKTIQRKTEDEGKIKLTVAIPVFSGAYSDVANQNAWKIQNAIGEYLEYELGVSNGTYKFDQVEYIENTDQYVALQYKDATNAITVRAELNFASGTVDVTG